MIIMEQTRKEYELPGPFKITALRHLIVGKVKEYFEIVESRNPGDYERILPEIQEYANRRRMEANSSMNQKMTQWTLEMLTSRIMLLDMNVGITGDTRKMT